MKRAVRQTCVPGLLLTVVAMLAFRADASAQGWRGLLPMRSTCRDVERVLGEGACGREQAAYDLPGESVWFNFSVDGCGGGRLSERYEVPTGTITGISVSLRGDKIVTLADLKADLARFEKKDVSDMIGVYKYVSREVGMYVQATGDGVVGNYAYFPPSSYDNLRCQPTPEPDSAENQKRLNAPARVGSFDPSSPDQESRILGEAIRKLKEHSGRKDGGEGPDGVVLLITFAGKGESLQAARLIAIRVRDRLVGHYKIAPEQVVTQEGGYRPRAEVVVYVQPLMKSAPNPPQAPRP